MDYIKQLKKSIFLLFEENDQMNYKIQNKKTQNLNMLDMFIEIASAILAVALYLFDLHIATDTHFVHLYIFNSFVDHSFRKSFFRFVQEQI